MEGNASKVFAVSPQAPGETKLQWHLCKKADRTCISEGATGLNSGTRGHRPARHLSPPLLQTPALATSHQLLVTSRQHRTGGSSQGDPAVLRNERHPDRKGRGKNISVCR